MQLVNPVTSFKWDILDINGVPFRGLQEKQGWSFSRAGYLAAKAGKTTDPDAWGQRARAELRPASKYAMSLARMDYELKSAPAFPRYMIIEPVGGVCGRKCPFCSINVIDRRDASGKPVKGNMKWAHFMKLMEECSRHNVYGLSAYMLGEPMYYIGRHEFGTVDIADMVNVAKMVAGFQVVNLSTFADVPNLSRLLECMLDDIIISIDGIDATVYAENRPSTKANDVGAFERTLERVHRFLEMKVQLGSRTPHVILQCINKSNTANSIADFVRYWIDVDGVDSVFIKNLDSMRSWIPGVVSEEEDAIKAAQVGSMACQHIFGIGAVFFNGVFSACCHDARSELTSSYGNIETSSFESWWNGPFMNELRREHLSGEFRVPCRDCRERDVWT